jgi:hypothetical protein
MACPYFEPVTADPACTPAHATLPLGDAWSGVCHADSGRPWQPGAETLYPLCNIGYARERCPRFPSGEGPDAVRFAIAAEGAAEEAATLRVSYVIERGHLPFAHGTLEYRLPEGDFRQPPDSATVARLARAYVASYFRRRAEAVPR